MKNKIFSGRSKDYDMFRVKYSEHLKSFLSSNIKIGNKFIIADMGSGTGLLAQILLELGARVFGVEPNDEMRKLGQENLSAFKNFTSIAGSAEHSNLENNSVDLITAGNAFHWFDSEKAKKEFQRILKPNGKILLVRTDWKEVVALRMKEYDRIICKYCVGRSGVVSNINLEREIIHKFFTHYEINILGESCVEYSREQLKGRFLSTSFSPQCGHVQYENAMRELDEIFDKYEKNEKFSFEVITTVVCGVI